MNKTVDKSDIYVAIMAGGVGSRFWPASRSSKPKQFLDILGTGKSLIRMTFERFLPICDPSNILIVTNAIYKDLVKEHLPEIGEEQILCEPSRNNTAPCIAYTAYKVQSLNPKAKLVVAPSDHLILKEDLFLKKITQALEYTESNDALVTLGIQPTRPDTGYGYINFEKEENLEVKKVIRFTEKPNLEKAKAFVEQGDYLWNAGIFIWSVDSILNAFKVYAKEICDLLGADLSIYNTDKEQAFIDEKYPQTPSISVDFAIMENAENIFTIPADIGWSDLGTWASLYEESVKDENANVNSDDRTLLFDTTSSILKTNPEKLVIVKGLHDYIVIDEEDTLLIYPKANEQEIKAITSMIRERFGESYL